MSSPDTIGALILWINSVQEENRTQHLRELTDGIILGQILYQACPDHFPTSAPPRSNTASTSSAENWVNQFSSLKRLYKLLITYFEDVLHLSTLSLAAPNLLVIAKSSGDFAKGESSYGTGAENEIIRLVGIILAALVQSDRKQLYIEGIQSLDVWVQNELMRCIEQVTRKVSSKRSQDTSASFEISVEGVPADDVDSEFYSYQHERSQLLTSQESLQILHEELLESHQALQVDHDAVLSNLDIAEKRVVELSRRPDGKAEVALRAECERLRNEVQRTERSFAIIEQTMDAQVRSNDDLIKKIEVLTPLAESATRLTDQMDEYRHLAEKARKNEALMEKYKKKVEETTGLHKSIKTLEEQNSDLLDKNIVLSGSLASSSSLALLADSHRHQISVLESKVSTLAIANEKLEHDLGKNKEKLRDERDESRRTVDRLREIDESLGRSENSVEVGASVETELNETISASSGSKTITALKLQIKQLQRDAEGSLLAHTIQEQALTGSSEADELLIKELKEKLSKAKAFIKDQDRIYKAAHASTQSNGTELNLASEIEEKYKSQLLNLANELERQKLHTVEIESRYRKEQQLMLSAYHELGMKIIRQGATATPLIPPSSTPTRVKPEWKVR